MIQIKTSENVKVYAQVFLKYQVVVYVYVCSFISISQ